MNKRIAPLALGFLAAAGILLTGFTKGQSETTLNALFMKQAAYSEDDIRAMTAGFEKANPGLKVNLEFVPA
jgi:multiple sugar transport system substrate-binding protein